MIMVMLLKKLKKTDLSMLKPDVALWYLLFSYFAPIYIPMAARVILNNFNILWKAHFFRACSHTFGYIEYLSTHKQTVKLDILVIFFMGYLGQKACDSARHSDSWPTSYVRRRLIWILLPPMWIFWRTTWKLGTLLFFVVVA